METPSLFYKKRHSKPAEAASSPEHLENAEFVQQTIAPGENRDWIENTRFYPQLYRCLCCLEESNL